MRQLSYQAGQFQSLLDNLKKQSTTGIVNVQIKTSTNTQKNRRVLAFRDGCLLFGGTTVPKNLELIQQLLKQSKSKFEDVAIKFVQNQDSLREVLESLTNVKLLQWEEIENFVFQQTVSIMEQTLAFAGTIALDRSQTFDLSFGEDRHPLNREKMAAELARRKKQWQTLSKTVPGMTAVPKISRGGLERVTDVIVCQHLQKWIDGKRNLMDIASGLEKDILQIANTYSNWVQNGWIEFEGTTANATAPVPKTTLKAGVTKAANSPSKATAPNKYQYTVLSVDDSPIVQKKIERALADNYNVLLASNAVDALNILKSNKVDVLLLDVTMPDIDGLEMCRTLRGISKFKHLPIIMVTGKDTLIDKMKGQIAGTNRYLFKPFDRETILKAIAELIGERKNSRVNGKMLRTTDPINLEELKRILSPAL